MYAPTLAEIFLTKEYVEVFTRAGIIPELKAQVEARCKEEGKAEIAQNLLAKGMPIEEIVQVTGLPYEKILALG